MSQGRNKDLRIGRAAKSRKEIVKGRDRVDRQGKGSGKKELVRDRERDRGGWVRGEAYIGQVYG